MHDLGARFFSTLLLSGALVFGAFLLFSILYPRKAAAASPASPASTASSRPKDYGFSPLWRVRSNGRSARPKPA